MIGITERLDGIADRLEKIGCVREATELDIVSNTLEKMAYTAKTDPKITNPVLGIAKYRAGMQKNAINLFIGVESQWNTFVSDYGRNIPQVVSAQDHYKKALELVKSPTDNTKKEEIARAMDAEMQECLKELETVQASISQEQIKVR